jgi:hypothetical protein
MWSSKNLFLVVVASDEVGEGVEVPKSDANLENPSHWRTQAGHELGRSGEGSDSKCRGHTVIALHEEGFFAPFGVTWERSVGEPEAALFVDDVDDPTRSDELKGADSEHDEHRVTRGDGTARDDLGPSA